MHSFAPTIALLFALLSLATALPTPSRAETSRIFGISLSERETYVACAMACRACRSCSEWTYDPDATSSCEYSCDTACAVDPFRYKKNAEGKGMSCPTRTEELKARWNVKASRGLRAIKERESRPRTVEERAIEEKRMGRQGVMKDRSEKIKMMKKKRIGTVNATKAKVPVVSVPGGTEAKAGDLRRNA